MSAIYSLTSGAKAQQRLVEATANNIANADTAGFKTDRSAFKEHLRKAVGVDLQSEEELFRSGNFITPYSKGSTTYVKTDDVLVDHSQGPLELTNNNFDFAISGEGFFTVDTPQGFRYTRDGTFSRNADGYLVDKSGHFVVGQNGRILVSGKHINVLEDGIVEVDNTFVDKMRIVRFDEQAKLNKVGHTYFAPKFENQRPIAMDVPVVRQGMIEASATDISAEMVSLMTANRLYESTQRAIKLMDEIDAKSNQLAKS